MNRNWRFQINMTPKTRRAAIPVRIVITANGVKPELMATFPKMGTTPKKMADESAAEMPFF
jgi:hypothetical protein